MLTPVSSRTINRRVWHVRRIGPAKIAALGALLVLACSAPTPIQPVSEPARDAAVDSSADPDASTDYDASSGGNAPSWCSARAIIALHCQQCHGSPPAHGAPFALVDYLDTQVLDRKGSPRFEAMARAVEQGTMPAQYIKLDPPVEPLQVTERTLLLSWCTSGGLLGGSDVCEGSP